MKYRLKNASKISKIFRYKTYKKLGALGKRKQLDRLFLFTLSSGLIISAFFLLKNPYDNKPDIPELSLTPSGTVINPNAQEYVHPDLGDSPVIEENINTQIQSLEEKVRLGTATMENYTIHTKESLAAFLNRTPVEKHLHTLIINKLAEEVDIKTIPPHTIIVLFFDENKSWLGLEILEQDKDVVALIKDTDSTIQSITQLGALQPIISRKTGQIEHTFNGSAKKAGVPYSIIQQAIDTVSGEFDFQRDLRPDDTFDFIYESLITPTGLELEAKRQLLFIGITGQKKKMYYYSYTDKTGIPSFYDAAGEKEKQYIAKRPVKAIPRLSSPYGWRMHPILLYKVFHKGVDLACPTGTPIYAAADGVVTQIGRKGAYGKYIKIQHENGYETAYAHLSGYRGGVKKWSRVKKGETIGYVGATGRVTGAHLHFEVIKNNKTVNPFGNYQIASKSLSGFELEQFQSFAESLHPDFQKHLYGSLPPTPPKNPYTPPTPTE